MVPARIGLASFLSAGALAFAALLLAAPLTATADASACERWGHSDPSEITHGQARDAILCLINEKRRHHGRSALGRDPRLQQAAEKHTEYMLGHRCFDHQCPGEPDPLRRLEQVDYITSGLSRWAYGENIAWGERRLGTPSAIVRSWMHSAGHRANILSGDFCHAGVGFVAGTPPSKDADGGTYTVDFGLRRG